MNAPATIPMREIERAQSALWALDPSCPYEEWVTIGMAAKAAGLAEGDWRDWSAQSDKFCGDAEIRTKWSSFGAGDVNAGTLFFKARQAGWQDPSVDVAPAGRGRKARRTDPSTIWDRAAPAPADHPYIVARDGVPDGLRVVDWPLAGWASFRNQSLEGWLVVPSRDEGGELVAVQLVSPAGDKLNPAGCSMRSGTFTLGGIRSGERVHVVEGVGHAWSCRALTGCAAVVAFGWSNVERAVTMVSRAGGEPVVVADRGKEHDAERLAQRLGCSIVLMPDDLPAGQDVNDLHRDRGAEAARAALQDERRPEAADNAVDAPVPLASPIPFDRPFPEVAQSGAPLNTLENVEHLLRSYGISVAYNEIAKEVEIQIPGREFAVDNAIGDALAEIRSLAARNRVPKGDLEEFITTLAGRNRRNPAREWIESAPWDGNDRIRDLALTLDPDDLELTEILLRRWLIGAVAAAYEPNGVALQGVLTLQGRQDGGKTTWCLVLAGERDDLFAEGVMLNPSDRDSVKPAISKWIVELGELDATFRKADIAALKSFITRRRDELRLPYARASSTFPRRTAFCATVNDDRFLRDETGNRRYWTIRCGKQMNARHGIDVQQVWAQAAHLWRSGEPHNLQRDELERLNAANEGHAEISPIEELIASRFDWSSDWRGTPMTATDVLIEVGYDRPNRQQTREASAALRKVCGGDPRKSGSRLLFDMPPRAGSPGDAGRPF
jgi:putative DNA primase/helicase